MKKFIVCFLLFIPIDVFGAQNLCGISGASQWPLPGLAQTDTILAVAIYARGSDASVNRVPNWHTAIFSKDSSNSMTTYFKDSS